MNVGVISDTHIRSFDEMPDAVVQALGKMDLIIHAGDFFHADVLEGLKGLGEVKAVRGNMDMGELREMLPETEGITIHGKRIGVIHGWGGPWGLEMKILQKLKDVDVIIYGHTHHARNEHIGNVLFFNPGEGSRSFGILTVTEGDVSGRIVRI